MAAIRDALARFPVIEKAILYGSRAKGTHRPGSDIDLTVTGNGLSLNNCLLPLLEELEKLDLPYRFDISILDQIDHPGLREHIARVGVVIYKRNSP